MVSHPEWQRSQTQGSQNQTEEPGVPEKDASVSSFGKKEQQNLSVTRRALGTPERYLNKESEASGERGLKVKEEAAFSRPYR